MADNAGNRQPEEPSEHTLGLSEELLAETYDMLRHMASRRLARQRGSPTLNTTLIVHEAWMKLTSDEARRFNDREHYLATASRAMRQVLVDHTRRKLAEKRGGTAEHVDIDAHPVADGAGGAESQLLDLDAALQDLSKRDPGLERVVECRFFAGMTVGETAHALGKSIRTVERDWARARTYLAAYLDAGG